MEKRCWQHLDSVIEFASGSSAAGQAGKRLFIIFLFFCILVLIHERVMERKRRFNNSEVKDLELVCSLFDVVERGLAGRCRAADACV